MQRAAPGFSLVEILLVVTILGIVTALALPVFSSTNADRLRSAASVLAADLDYVRGESIAHPSDTRVIVFDTATERYHIAAASTSSTPLQNLFTKEDHIVSFGSGTVSSLIGVTIDSVSVGGDDELGFDAFGAPDQITDATITLGCEGATIVLTVKAGSGEVVVGQIN
ncbi:MAG: prepilin-type N-terminal cleavage/methylation domain-containing protein [Planctomycetota bacterium]